MIVFKRIANTVELLNRAIAELEWQTLANRSIIPSEIFMNFNRLKLKLKNGWCAKLMDLQTNGVSVDGNVLHFLCKGPKYTDEIAGYNKCLLIKIGNSSNFNPFLLPVSFCRKITDMNQLLSSAYNSARICKIENHTQRCYNGELDVGKLMATSRSVITESKLLSTAQYFFFYFFY